jgi:hypothetical protein
MTSPAGNGNSRPQTWSARLLGAFSGPRTAQGDGSAAKASPGEVLPPEERKAVMVTLDPQERKWVLGALLLATVSGIAIPAYIVATNKITKRGKNTIAVAPDAKLLGAAILILCVIGFLALWRRRRTFVAFDLFLIGFGFTLFIGLVGFVFILLGGWLMLRAWRINKYGTTSSKAIAAQARERPKGRDRKQPAKTAGKKTTQTGDRKPPTASKRYTPKAPPRKKIPKPTE